MTTDDLEFNNAWIMLSKIQELLLRMQDEANVLEVYDSMHQHYKFIMDTGATYVSLQLAKQGSLSVDHSIAIYRAYMYMHKTNINTLLNWDFSE